ncbi:MAG TPA: signal recognition particle-docking protein FtsY [Dehalococcoidia bacterium]
MVRFFRRKKDDEAADEGAPAEDAIAVNEDVAEEGPEPADAEGEIAAGVAPGTDAEEAAPVEEAVERTRKTWFGRIGGIFKRGLDDSLWEELEETLIAADTGVQTTIRIIDEVQTRVKEESIREPEAALDALKEELIEVLDVDTGRGKIWSANGDLDSANGMSVILVVGVNGTGKTTSIGKMAHAYKARGKKVVLAAGDTFRAAAIDQLKSWGERAGVDVIAHQQGADPGAVVFDALAAAEKRGAEVLIIDTAGRLHTKANLMEELRKVDRVIRRQVPEGPDEVLLVLDATSGQNAMQQAKYFTEAVGVTAVLLAKLDGTAKGGVVFSVCDQLRVPVRFVGTGERPQDLARFEPRSFVEALFSGQ